VTENVKNEEGMFIIPPKAITSGLVWDATDTVVAERTVYLTPEES